MAKLKAERNNEALKRALDELAEATMKHDNVMPAVMKSVHEYGTIGEIMSLWTKLLTPQASGSQII